MAKRRPRRSDPVAEWRARMEAAVARTDGLIREHADAAMVLAIQDDGDQGYDTFVGGCGHPVHIQGLMLAACDYYVREDSIVSEETDELRAQAVRKSCAEMSGLAEHGVIAIPATSDGTSVYVQHLGSELVVTEAVKQMDELLKSPKPRRKRS